jgi:hypothetical protein
MTDPLLRMLAALPQGEPDPDRAAHVRATCHAVLERRRVRRSTRSNGSAHLWELAVAGLGAIYLTETLRQALLFYGVL